MKPAPFRYSRPESLADALDALGPESKVLAGGQSLLPLLSMRLVAPEHLVDINRLRELAYVRVSMDGVRVGALARHAQVEHSDAAYAVQPLLRRALRLVAHPTIRNRGTTVGSIVHADPSGEMTAVLALLGGRLTVASRSGRRDIDADALFLGPMESAVAPGELAVEAFFPALDPGARTAFCEVARRHGDYAVCGAAALVHDDQARVALISVAPTPLIVTARVSEIRDAVLAAVDPEADIHASSAYRRHLAGVLAERAVAQAAA